LSGLIFKMLCVLEHIYVQDLMGSTDVWVPDIVLFRLPMSRHISLEERAAWSCNLFHSDLNKRAVNLIENAVIVNLLYHLLLTKEIN